MASNDSRKGVAPPQYANGFAIQKEATNGQRNVIPKTKSKQKNASN